MAIIAGCRTPFAKASTVFRDLSAVDLARVAVRELVERTEVEPAWIDTVVMGQVIPSVNAPNLAREVVLGQVIARAREKQRLDGLRRGAQGRGQLRVARRRDDGAVLNGDRVHAVDRLDDLAAGDGYAERLRHGWERRCQNFLR